MGDALDVVEGEVHVGGLGRGQNVQDRVGGPSHGHIHGHGVLEGLLGGDGPGEYRLVVLLVVPIGDFDHHPAGLFEEHLPGGVGSQGGAVAGQGQAHGLGQAVHGIGGEHTCTGAACWADGLLQGQDPLVVDGVVGRSVHDIDQVGVLFDRSIRHDRSAGFHGAAGDENRRYVKPQCCHEHARSDLVAVGDADQGVGTVGVDRVLDGVRDDVPGGKGVQHAGVAHGDAVIDGYGVELPGNATCCLNGLGDQSAHLVQVDVAGNELREGIGDGHDGLAEVLTLDAGGTIESTGARELTFLHQLG